MGCKNVEKRSSTNFFLEKCKVETIRKKLREKLKWIVLFVGMNLKEAFEKISKNFIEIFWLFSEWKPIVVDLIFDTWVAYEEFFLKGSLGI